MTRWLVLKGALTRANNRQKHHANTHKCRSNIKEGDQLFHDATHFGPRDHNYKNPKVEKVEWNILYRWVYHAQQLRNIFLSNLEVAKHHF